MYYIERSFKIEINALKLQKVTRFTRPALNDQLDLRDHGGSQAKPLNVCSTYKKIANMNSGLMLQRYGLKSGILYNF